METERNSYAPYVDPNTGEIVFPDQGDDDTNLFWDEENSQYIDSEGNPVDTAEIEDLEDPQPGDYVIDGDEIFQVPAEEGEEAVESQDLNDFFNDSEMEENLQGEQPPQSESIPVEDLLEETPALEMEEVATEPEELSIPERCQQRVSAMARNPYQRVESTKIYAYIYSLHRRGGSRRKLQRYVNDLTDMEIPIEDLHRVTEEIVQNFGSPQKALRHRSYDNEEAETSMRI